ncbi:MAG TPA: NADH-quinone oxidoreductase subunit A [Methylomirabilota bacterium]|nr:NADH-quinone oxidoreductase subunit A [Methylomirabilota bacterium]
MLTPYVPLLILFVVATGFGLAILGLSNVIGPRKPSPVKVQTYESGMTALGPAGQHVPIRFYLVATLFILFDIEVIYLYPWAVRFRQLAAPVAEGGLGYGALAGMGIFLGVLVIGFIHVWRAGALEWD